MAWNSSKVLLIDPDETARRELADLLLNRPDPPRVWVADSVRAAESILRCERVEWLFIRIIVWDDYQRLRPTLVGWAPRVVFLSGRNEKCTAHLSLSLDAHLQPPYRNGHLGRIWNRWMDPRFAERPLDIFFIKSRARFEPVRYGDLQQVDVENGKLRLQTRHADYCVSGSLQAFQDRLPVSLTMIRRGCLINEGFKGFGSGESFRVFGSGVASVRARL